MTTIAMALIGWGYGRYIRGLPFGQWLIALALFCFVAVSARHACRTIIP